MRTTPVRVLRNVAGRPSGTPREESWSDLKSNINVEDKEDKKAEVVLRLLELHRSHILTWHQQAYIAATASLALMVYIFDSYAKLLPEQHNLRTRLIYVVGVALFAGLVQLYLDVVASNYEGNEKCVIKCEYALKLKTDGVYFTASPEARPQPETTIYHRPDKGPDRGMPPEDVALLAWSHLVVSVMLLLALLWLK